MLLMGEVGFIAPQYPRFVGTVEALGRQLCDGPLHAPLRGGR